MTGFKSKKNSAIAKFLEDYKLPDTPTARAYLSRVLEEDDDTQGYVADKVQKPVFESWREFASDYERGFIDGMQKQAQSSVDKAVNQMAQPAQEPVAWLCENAAGHRYFRWKKPSGMYKPIPLYTKEKDT